MLGIIILIAIASLSIQCLLCSKIEWFWLHLTCGCLGGMPGLLRGVAITYSLHVFPEFLGGSCFEQSALVHGGEYSLWFTRLFVLTGVFTSWTLAPFVAFWHSFVPCFPGNYIGNQWANGGAGLGPVSKRGWPLFKFFLKHPFAVWGEGFGNGAGLATYSAGESIIFPYSKLKPTFFNVCHDKLWQEKLFNRHNAPQARVFAVFRGSANCEKRDIHQQGEKYPLIWKPVYGTMGLGIERCASLAATPPSKRAWYMQVEQIIPAYYPRAEWFRIATIWDWRETKPKFSYCWRTINGPEDPRVQTEIIGGHATFVKGSPAGFVGTKQDYGQPEHQHGFYDPRADAWINADPYTAPLLLAYEKALGMHEELGKEFYTIGWDVMVDKEGCKFLEFNVNNGFLVSDHGVDQCNRMLDFFWTQVQLRLGDPAFGTKALPNGTILL